MGGNYLSTSDNSITVYGLTGPVNYAYQNSVSYYYCQSTCSGSVSGAASIVADYYASSSLTQYVIITTTTDVPEFQGTAPIILIIVALTAATVRLACLNSSRKTEKHQKNER